MYDYSIVPCDKIKKRMDFFYTPYNQKFLLRKHMTFEESEAKTEVADPAQASVKRYQMKSCLESLEKEL